MIQATASMYIIKPLDANPLSRLFNYFLRMRGVNMRERPCFISTAHTAADFEKTYEAIRLAITDMFDADLIQPYEGEDLNVIYSNQKGITIPTVSSVKPISIPLSDGQEEIWLAHQLSPEAAKAFNILSQINLIGNLDYEKLKAAIAQVVLRLSLIHI